MIRIFGGSPSERAGGYGDEARDDFLNGIREILNAGEPTAFMADVNTSSVIGDVVDQVDKRT